MKISRLLSFGLILLFMLSQDILSQQTQESTREEGAVVFDVKGYHDVIFKKDIPYQENLTMDVYYPPKFNFQNSLPAIIIVLGYTDKAGEKLIGGDFKSYVTLTSWCRIIAASGLAAITYQSDNPEEDILALLSFIESNDEKLRIDPNNLAAFSQSAHTPTMISTLLGESTNRFKCATAYFGFFLTSGFKYLPEIDSISDIMGFMTPRLPDPINWRKDIPILVVRAGKDNVPFINQSLSSFYKEAINQNLPITLINYPSGLHGFDALNDNETTRQIVKTTLDFWQHHLNQKQHLTNH